MVRGVLEVWSSIWSWQICLRQQYGHQMERRGPLCGLGPHWGASDCAPERKFMCTWIHVFDLPPWGIIIQEKQEPGPAHHFLSFLQNRALLIVCHPQAQLPTFLSALSMTSFYVLAQCLTRLRSPQLGEETMLCKVAPLLCEVDLTASRRGRTQLF